jgi:hypothetical protein
MFLGRNPPLREARCVNGGGGTWEQFSYMHWCKVVQSVSRWQHNVFQVFCSSVGLGLRVIWSISLKIVMVFSLKVVWALLSKFLGSGDMRRGS